MQITLSTGEKVTFRERWSHGIAKRFNLKMFAGGTPTIESIYAAYEEIFPALIESIDLGGKPVEFSQEWLDALPEKDYLLVRDAADSIDEAKKEKGKKNP